MKALILEKNGKIRYTETKTPIPKENEYRIRVVGAGICGSDLPRAFENKAYHTPLIMGHEFSGIVEHAPKNGHYIEGTRVVVFPLLPCYQCEPCSIEEYAQCTNYDYLGSRRDGAFAEFVCVPEANLFPVPDSVNLLHAALTEPCAVALHGIRKMAISGGETGIVFGGGPIGLVCAQWLKILGCSTVIVVEIDEKKRAIARQLGFRDINPEQEDTQRTILDLTKGRGADKVVEACGLPVTLRAALKAAGRWGEVVIMGNAQKDLVLPPDELSQVLRKELRLMGTWNSKIGPRPLDDWSTVLTALSGTLQVAPLISHTVDLSEGPEIFNRMITKSEFFNKVIFKVSEE